MGSNKYKYFIDTHDTNVPWKVFRYLRFTRGCICLMTRYSVLFYLNIRAFTLAQNVNTFTTSAING